MHFVTLVTIRVSYLQMYFQISYFGVENCVGINVVANNATGPKTMGGRPEPTKIVYFKIS